MFQWWIDISSSVNHAQQAINSIGLACRIWQLGRVITMGA